MSDEGGFESSVTACEAVNSDFAQVKGVHDELMQAYLELWQCLSRLEAEGKESGARSFVAGHIRNRCEQLRLAYVQRSEALALDESTAGARKWLSDAARALEGFRETFPSAAALWRRRLAFVTGVIAAIAAAVSQFTGLDEWSQKQVSDLDVADVAAVGTGVVGVAVGIVIPLYAGAVVGSIHARDWLLGGAEDGRWALRPRARRARTIGKNILACEARLFDALAIGWRSVHQVDATLLALPLWTATAVIFLWSFVQTTSGWVLAAAYPLGFAAAFVYYRATKRRWATRVSPRND